MTLLFSIITLPNLRKVILDMEICTINNISWPYLSNLQHLFIGKCTFEQFCSILHHSANLQVVCMNDCHMSKTDKTEVPIFYRQLISLEVKNSKMSIDQHERLLQVTPSLVHLNLRTCGISVDFIERFSEWEKFIRQKLPQLEKFKFHFSN